MNLNICLIVFFVCVEYVTNARPSTEKTPLLGDVGFEIVIMTKDMSFVKIIQFLFLLVYREDTQNFFHFVENRR